ncbi:hypothetical protein LC048_13625 [Mesobacillus subterraneus]|uniref:hypothetical protein n=1 Tax=Mesobacillus subterraneus TaxID=285983 RepID=UPI001CFF3EDC|nr:hypothetical protein [Mesobacillus subterraneus]WLR53563.1 hypothetical protein LC048_13625 [Mesobacillus subterraneus]
MKLWHINEPKVEFVNLFEERKKEIDYLRSLLDDENLNDDVKEEINLCIITILQAMSKPSFLVRTDEESAGRRIRMEGLGLK